MTHALAFEVSASQLKGPRQYQNDSYYVGEHWLVVADGAGSHASARDVADHVVEHYGDLAKSVTSQLIAAALTGAPQRLSSSLAAAGNTDASTVIAAVLDDADMLWLSSVGDSRFVVMRNGNIITANSLHNQRAAALFLHPGAEVPYGADAMLTRYIAAGESYPADVSIIQPLPDDIVLLLSDGVESALGLAAIIDTINASGPDPQLINRDIMSAASMKGLSDNATCVAGRIIRGIS